jgi:predicted nucleic-acid-binding protein
MVKFVDTNILIRFVTDDVPDLAEQARALVKNARKNELVVTDAVLAEMCQVLQFNPEFRMERPLIGRALKGLFAISVFDFSELARKAVEIYIAHTKLDFVDCLLAAQAELYGGEIITFDKKLQKVLTTSKG